MCGRTVAPTRRVRPCAHGTPRGRTRPCAHGTLPRGLLRRVHAPGSSAPNTQEARIRAAMYVCHVIVLAARAAAVTGRGVCMGGDDAPEGSHVAQHLPQQRHATLEAARCWHCHTHTRKISNSAYECALEGWEGEGIDGTQVARGTHEKLWTTVTVWCSSLSWLASKQMVKACCQRRRTAARPAG